MINATTAPRQDFAPPSRGGDSGGARVFSARLSIIARAALMLLLGTSSTTINRNNVKRVGLAWEASLDSERGLQATPIVVNGVIYVTSTWSRVFAFDARSGERLWSYDPEVPKAWARRACCDVINRGVAVERDRVYLGTLDGRLIALDASDGSLIWEVNTIDRALNYSITGAPRVVKDMVIIGNGGADLGVRGYVSAYGTDAGELRWRFYTVPGSAEGPFEHPELEMAADTWDPNSLWEQGGGGTVWDSMSYDPDLNLLYVGTGNGSPWPGYVRSPAGGDNLFLSSILALNPDTGRLVWHYQTTPYDSYDYTATQHIILMDGEWEGQERKLLLQAPKNGFFYVLDRESGELLAADKFARATWAERVDLKTGRPVLSPVSDYREQAQIIFPGTLGAHSWHPMAYNPDTGLTYIPAQDLATHFSPSQLTILLDSAPAGYEQRVPDRVAGFANLVAWDVRKRGIRWSVRYPTLGNAGVLSTAGGLVIQGDAQGYVNFYDAVTGERLHRLGTRTGIVAPPVTYELDGEQYIALAAGWGGALFVLTEPEVAASSFSNAGRLLVLKLDGKDIPQAPALQEPKRAPMGERLVKLDASEIAGQTIYNTQCGACHGWFGRNGLLPNLRRSSPATIDALEEIVLGGLLQGRGMPSFADDLTIADVEMLKAYLRRVRLE